MSFDVAVGVNQQQLNACSQQLYGNIPNLFQGSGSDPKYPGITMTWQATQAPLFNLSPTAASVAALRETAVSNTTEEHAELLNEPAFQAALANAPAFDVNFPNLQIILKQADNEQTVLNLNVTLGCLLSVSGGNLQLAASSATYQPLKDPIEDFFARSLVMPQLLASANKALAGLSIPPPDMPGIQLSPIAATIQNGAIIAVTNLINNGPASIPSGYSWPSSSFFALLSQPALQAVTNVAISSSSNYAGKGEVGSSVGGADYHYSINITHPTVRISGNDIVMDFGVNGNVGAKVTVLWVPIGVNYDVEGGPAPEATAALQPAGGNHMNIIARSLNAFTFLLKPSGSIIEKIISAITWPITQAITAVVTPIVTTSLHNINFTSYTLPAYKVNINNTQMQFIPEVSNVGNWQGMMGITGSLAVIS